MYFQSGEQVVDNSNDGNQPGQNSPKPAKTGSWWMVGVISLVLLAAGGLLIHEKSPLNITNLLAGMEHDGRYASEWRAELKSPEKDKRRAAVIAVGNMVDKTPATIATL